MVVAELLVRGLRPYRPVVDDHGVDILLDNGARLQVKSTTLWKYKYDRTGKRSHRVDPVYRFSLLTDMQKRHGAAKLRATGNGSRRSLAYSSFADFFILCGIEERRFWVVPTCIVDNRQMIVLGPKAIPSPTKFLELVASGLSKREASRQLGFGSSKWYWSGRGESVTGKWVRLSRQCEDRWDLLTLNEPVGTVNFKALTDVDELDRIFSLTRKDDKETSNAI